MARAIAIPEPSHVSAKVAHRNANYITKWYFGAHERNFKHACGMARRGKAVFVERSSLSSIAFSKVYLNKGEAKRLCSFKRCLKNVRRNSNAKVLIVYLKPRKLTDVAKQMRTNSYLKNYAAIKLLRSLNRELLLAIKEIKKSGAASVFMNPSPESLSVHLK